jgi:putative transposase
VSRAGFYKWTVSSPSNRSIENQIIETEVSQASENSKKIYGNPMITFELHKKAIRVSRTRAVRIMKKAKLRSIVKKKFKVIIDSSHKFPLPENVLEHDFKPGILGLSGYPILLTSEPDKAGCT